MIIGFKTDQGSLYWIDPQGYTRRFKRGNYVQSAGEMNEPHACLFLNEKFQSQVHGIDTDSYRVYISVLNHGLVQECSEADGLRSAIARGDRACLAVMHRASQTLAVDMGGPCPIQPALGLFPFEQTYMPDKEGVTRRHYHLGNRIVHLFHTTADLVQHGYPIATLMKHGGLTQTASNPRLSGPG